MIDERASAFVNERLEEKSRRACPRKACPAGPASKIIFAEAIMKLLKEQIKIERPRREKVTREEALKRAKAFPKRKERLIAAIREGKDRDIRS
jgi:hypothetical protein